MSEERVTKKTTVVFVLLIVLLSFACRHEQQGSTATQSTETIAPAAAKPDTSGTDQMTQTVDVEDSRSEAEADNAHSAPTTDTAVRPATATAPAPAATTAPPAPKPHR